MAAVSLGIVQEKFGRLWLVAALYRLAGEPLFTHTMCGFLVVK